MKYLGFLGFNKFKIKLLFIHGREVVAQYEECVLLRVMVDSWPQAGNIR